MRKRKHAAAGEGGEIMLESTIIVTLTLFVLIWLLGVGFAYYQRAVATIVTNDVAVKIASTYSNPATDIVMGYTSREDVASRKIYRGKFSNENNFDLKEYNQERASAYVKYMLKRTNFANTVDVENDVEVTLKLVYDDTLRRHVEVTTVCTFQTPFGAGLELFGMDGTMTYESHAAADCTDLSDYIANVDYQTLLAKGTFLSGTGALQSAWKLINSIAEKLG